MKLRQKGFTGIELMGMLIVFAFILLIFHNILDEIDNVKMQNQLADQVQHFGKVAIRYIEDNYHDLVAKTSKNQDLVIPYTAIKGYPPSGLSFLTAQHQIPCVYIVSDTKNNKMGSILVYLFLSSNDKTHMELDSLFLAKTVNTIGSNAGILVNENDRYIFQSKLENELTLSDTVMSKIADKCGFVFPLATKTLVIDLSKQLFNSIDGDIDKNSQFTDDDPSLKKDGELNAMQTNLYMDDIYKEASNHVKYECKVGEIQPEATKLCSDFAVNNGVYLKNDTASWVSSVLNKDKNACISSATGDFYRTNISYSCDDVYMGDLDNICTYDREHKIIVPKSGTWLPAVPELVGVNCEADGYIKYQTQDGVIDKDPTFCRHMKVKAKSTETKIDLGSISCGQQETEAQSTKLQDPALHAYKGLDYGINLNNNQRIKLIASEAIVKNKKTRTILNVDNSGLQAGKIKVISNSNVTYDNCDRSKLGQMVQEQNGLVILSQLQCTYSPTFCGGDGYCYLPIKTTSFTEIFNLPKERGTCPSGTIINKNQPEDGIIWSVNCPPKTGWRVVQGIHGVEFECYTNKAGSQNCHSYQTICTYLDKDDNQQSLAIPALIKLSCSNATATYVIDNYVNN